MVTLRPQVVEKSRADSKAQLEREKAEGKLTVIDHGKRTRTDSWTRDMYAAAHTKKMATYARTCTQIVAGGVNTKALKHAETAKIKRNKMLSVLSGDELARKTRQYENHDEKRDFLYARSLALLKLPKYSTKKLSWARSNCTKVDDVVYFEDANGLVCARLASPEEATAARDATRAKRDATAQAKRDATAAGKRAKVLAGLTDDERKKKQAKYDCVDRALFRRKSKANALLKLPEYSDKTYRWCYFNLTQASKDGVVFFQDAEGVWFARMVEHGAAGSSAEHAAF